jgi:SAM-dependent methyltransferase
MKQNIFDDERFFSAYAEYRQSPNCINSIIEQPALRRLLPDLKGTRVLDIGCGAGAFCQYALEQGAAFVLGLDISRRMCAQAESTIGGAPNVKIINQAIEDFDWQGGTFDVIVSSLTLHYVEPLAEVLKKSASWLHSNGVYLFSVNHPFYTAVLGSEPTSDTCFNIQNYWNEGLRKHTWFVEGVVKYHRTLETYTRLLYSVGLRLTSLYELSPQTAGVNEWRGDPELAERPLFILFTSEKQRG